MLHDLVPLAFFAMITTVSIAVGVPIARALARRISPTSSSAALPEDAQQRLERMEQAIEAIAVEVERIAEGQRFTTRLLAERQPAPAVGAGAPMTQREER